MKPCRSPETAAEAVLTVLAGTPLHQAAARTGIEPGDLADAVDLYQTAGLAALGTHAQATEGWHQVRIEFTNWEKAEHTAATSLGPPLQQAEQAGTISSWWFTRKAPCWRLRCHPGRPATMADLTAFLSRILDAMLAHDMIASARTAIYEPEGYAFGGPQGMHIAHRLFHADSRNVLSYLNRPGPGTQPGRRELSILLCSSLMRAAGQDWYEQGDIWNRVAENRPTLPGTPLERLPRIAPDLKRLMTVDASNLVHVGALAPAAEWIRAFQQAGTALAEAASDGRLGRGPRDILAHHVIFHWNRIGLSLRTQSILAAAARDAVFRR